MSQHYYAPSSSPPYGAQQQQSYGIPSDSSRRYGHSLHRNEGISLSQASSLLALGGLLGVTAAAAVRWLNGGDFNLLPPPNEKDRDNLRFELQPPTTANTLEEGRSADLTSNETEMNSKVHEEADNYDGDDGICLEAQNDDSEIRILSEEVRSLVSTVKLHTEQQELLLKKISSQNERQLTNESMQLLRSKDKESALEKLGGIREELSGLRNDLVSKEGDGLSGDSASIKEKWEERLTSLLDNLQAHLDNHHRTGPSDTAVVSAELNDTTLCSTPNARITRPTQAREIDRLFMDAKRHENLLKSIKFLITENNFSDLQAATKLLYLYVRNLAEHPHVPRYRKIYTGNESFRKVDRIQGGKEFLVTVGFEEKDGVLEWLPSDDGSKKNQEVEAWAQTLSQAVAALKALNTFPWGRTPPKRELIDHACRSLIQQPSSLSISGSRDGASKSDGDAMSTDSSTAQIAKYAEVTPLILRTPEFSSIASPPTTKKQFLSPTALELPSGSPFPPLEQQPKLQEGSKDSTSVGKNSRLSPTTSSMTDNEVISIQDDRIEAVNGTDTMWK